MDRPLYADDIVVKKADTKRLAVVDRTPDDIDTHIPYPGRTEEEKLRCDKSISSAVFKQFKKDGIPPKGTIAVRWRDEFGMELIPASKVKLLDRSLLIGDIVKRGVNDAMSGCVINTYTSCNLQPMCDITHRGSERLKGLLPPGNFTPSDSQFCVYPNDQPPLLENVPASELKYAEVVSEDELVIFRDWIGRVEAVTNNIRVRLTDNCVVEIGDEVGEHPDGAIGSFVIGDICKTKKGQLRTGEWIYGSYNPNTPPVGTVVGVRTVGADISWIEKRLGSTDLQEPPHLLEYPELESAQFAMYDRSRRPTTLDESFYPETVSNSDIDIRLNLRVRFKDLTGARVKYNTTLNPNALPVLERRDTLGYDLNVFDVVSFRTHVTVQWQDLSVTTEDSIDLVPDGSIDDEHAVWPGEICHTLALRPVEGYRNVEKPDKVGVIQSVKPSDRMAKVKFAPDSYIHYSKREDAAFEELPIIARYISTDVGSSEEISLYDIEAPALMNVRRGDIVMVNKARYNNLASAPSDRTWLGEIVDTLLDGSLIVRLGAASEVRDIKLLRHEMEVAVRSDNTTQADIWDEGQGEDIDDDDFDGESDSMDLSDEEWDDSDDEDEDEEAKAWYENEKGELMDEDEVEDEDWEDAHDTSDAEMHDAPEHQTPPTSHSANPPRPQERAEGAPITSAHNAMSSEAPAPYMVLEGEVPGDHRYRNEPTTETSAHVKRTQKEHKILRNPSTLPDGVYIRTWESRLDLLRVMLVGPTETPYAYAPFVVDIYLPPSFPAEPPQVFFHSWPAHASIGAIGRVNPNLYEDGKICLSILGTWEGNKGESWSAARSTLLQVIVSLLGLVLVREPYYNEAGYEALQGTEASKRSSALYSERIFLRAKGFLITAASQIDTATGLKGLEDVVRWLYRDPKGPKLLDASIQQVEEVLESSDGSQEADGLSVLSKGACIPASRVLSRLKELKDL